MSGNEAQEGGHQRTRRRPRPRRTASRHRVYDLRAVTQLRFIKHAQDLGLSLADIKRLLPLRDSAGAASCRRVTEVLEARLGAYEERIESFDSYSQRLREALRRCRDGGADPCQLLTDLADTQHRELLAVPAPEGACLPADTALCLNDGRFRVELAWRDFQGNTGSGRVVPGVASADSGLLWFFAPGNWEVLVKVLDGCALNGHYWVFAAATTSVEYTLVVTDTASGEEARYENPLGRAAPAITDTQAFAACP